MEVNNIINIAQGIMFAISSISFSKALFTLKRRFKHQHKEMNSWMLNWIWISFAIGSFTQFSASVLTSTWKNILMTPSYFAILFLSLWILRFHKKKVL